MDGRSITIVDFEALSLLSDSEKSYLGQIGRPERLGTQDAALGKLVGREMGKWTA